MTKSISNIHYS